MIDYKFAPHAVKVHTCTVGAPARTFRRSSEGGGKRGNRKDTKRRSSRLVRAVRHSFAAGVKKVGPPHGCAAHYATRVLPISTAVVRTAMNSHVAPGLQWSALGVFEKAGNLTCAKPPLTGASVISHGADSGLLWSMCSIPNKKASLDIRTEAVFTIESMKF